MKTIIPALLAILFFLFSCDPARRIEMKNKTSDTAEIIWKSKEDSIAFNPFVISNSRELRLIIPPRKKAKIKMSFGMGTWTPTEVERTISKLESFEIISAKHNIRIDSMPRLKEYLLARRKGVGGSKIEILINE